MSNDFAADNFADQLDAASDQLGREETVELEIRLNQARQETTAAKRITRAQAAEIERLEDELQKVTILTATAAETGVPKWLTPKIKKKDLHHKTTPVLILSDLHFDEVVDLREMDGLNEYNRAIADQRFDRVIDKTVWMLKHQIQGADYDSMVVGLLGDILTGEIHDELIETNEAPVADSVVYWWPRLASGLTHIADELDTRIYVPCVDGNHDRIGQKKKSKGRAKSSLAWIMYHTIAKHLDGDDRFEFAISDSGRVRFPIYDTWFLAEHGDTGIGRSAGSGIGGVWPPIMRKVTKDHRNMAAARQQVDVTLMGHWHQLTYADTLGFIINGDLKGADEWGRSMGFSPQRPQQALFTVTPENGISIRTTVYADG